MRTVLFLFCCAALALTGCKGDGQTVSADFTAAKHEADSVYNTMAFNDAYDRYRQLLSRPDVRQDNAKRLEVLACLSDVSELASQKNDQMQWLRQLLDLARACHDDYYLSQGLMLMGKHVCREGDSRQGIGYIREAISLMEQADKANADHLAHSQMNTLSNILAGQHDFQAAVANDERNVRLTHEGTRWGKNPEQQLRDRRTALAKLAVHLVQAGQPDRADSAYGAWKAVPLTGSNPRDYFIVDYLRERGRYAEAATIYEGLLARFRTQSDTLGNMMLFAKWGLAEVCQKTGDYRRAANLYTEILEINDTLQARQARSNAQELAALYETQEKVQQLHVREMWIVRLCSCAAVLLVLVVTTLLYVRRMRQKNRFLAQTLNELTRQQMLHETAETAHSIAETGRSITGIGHATTETTHSTGKTDAEPSAASADATAEAHDDGAALFLALDRSLEADRLYLKPDLNRDDLCNLIGVDKNTLGNLLQQYSSAANSQVYINRKRIQHAVRLMQAHPEWTMQSVAVACGMKNTVTFNRVFRQTYGMTPTEYLKSSSRGGVRTRLLDKMLQPFDRMLQTSPTFCCAD